MRQRRMAGAEGVCKGESERGITREGGITRGREAQDPWPERGESIRAGRVAGVHGMEGRTLVSTAEQQAEAARVPQAPPRREFSEKELYGLFGGKIVLNELLEAWLVHDQT